MISLSRSYRQRQDWKQFDTTMKRSLTALKNSDVKDMNFHYLNYQLEQELKEEIKEMPPLPEKYWLLQQLKVNK